ncbi:DUF1707 SHOCT-like domain-containing protein [Mariniluteicoccus flavus]
MDTTPTAALPMDLAPTETRDPTTTPTGPHLRVGDDERSAVCEMLAANFTLGRLTPDDLDERLARALNATRRADLDELIDDLPPLPPAPVAPPQSPLRTMFEAAGVLSALGAMGIVGLMIVGSLFLGVGVWFFTLVGGTLTAYFTAVLTRSYYRSHPPQGAPRPGGPRAAGGPAR